MTGSEYLQQIREHLKSAYLLSDEKIESVLPSFLKTLATLINELECAAEKKNEHEALGRKGHALKGALLNLGLPGLAEKAYLIEQHGSTDNLKSEYEQVVAELKNEITKFC